jgi:hypothetical protein
MVRTSCLVLVGALATLLGCSDSTTPPADAGPADTGQVDAGSADTGPADAGRMMREPQGIYGECVADAECGEGLRCFTERETGLPGGYCNRECTSPDDCVREEPGVPPIDGFCQAADANGRRYCARVCANGQDCERNGYTCIQQNANTLNAVRVCIAVCTPTSCTDGTTCDGNSGRCRATGATLTGRTIGERCLANRDPASTAENRCRSELCNPEVTTDSRGVPFYTGFNGGQCVGRCILPQGYNPSTFWDETRLPQGSCPSGAICFPNGSLARGDLGVCLDECSQDSDCRTAEGYFCRKTIQLSTTNTRRFDNGWCTPINCVNTATPCPTGYMCERRTSQGTTTGACIPVRSADAGAGVSDASGADGGA